MKYKTAIICLLVAAVCRVEIKNNAIGMELTKMSDHDIEIRGKILRQKIDHRYRSLVESHTLKAGFRDVNDITDVVEGEIPVGTSFDEAEKILKTAGFRVDPRPGVNPLGNRPDRFDVVAAITPYAHESLAKVSLFVSLSPAVPGKYESVNRMSASIVVTNS